MKRTPLVNGDDALEEQTPMRFSLHLLSLVLLTTCIFFCAAYQAAGQTETATISGQIVDSAGAIVRGASVELQSVQRGTSSTTTTNDAGIYVLSAVLPGQYSVTVRKQGFKQVDLVGVVANVQDHIEQNFRLEVGSVSESVTVAADKNNINTTDGSVSTIVDRQFAENLPLNGRSFQSLINLTPGVVVTPSNGYDDGQFSVNGQRTDANYWMVDGVSANIGISVSNPSSGMAGSLGSFSVLGGTNSLVSVDALQEFRIQTSNFAPEFGRTPGAQISIATRSGANRFSGTAFDYLRNDVLDANDWFADEAGLPKPKERQNDFGGTFGGPIWKDQTFFFFSYEGLRLRLPGTTLTTVPDLSARMSALPALQPYLNVFPKPNGADDVSTGIAQFNASYSNPATLDAYSLRVDHKFKSPWSLFGRYDYSPSSTIERGTGVTLNNPLTSSVTTQTSTVGIIWTPTPRALNDLRLNYSRTTGSSSESLDNFGGGVPLTSLPFPNPYNSSDAALAVDIANLTDGLFDVGKLHTSTQRQFNIVESFSLQKSSHTLKFGVDYRQLSPVLKPSLYRQLALFPDVPSASNGNLLLSYVSSSVRATFLFRNLSAFAQDTWRASPRLTLTYGIRWDIDFAPTTTDGPDLPAVTGYNPNNLSTLALAPAGATPYQTPYNGIAPRFGAAYEISQDPRWRSVIRGGAGVFYDLASGQVGNLIWQSDYPYGASAYGFGGTFPLNSSSAAAPPITVPGSGSGAVTAFDPNLKLPYSFQWDIALEQGIGKQQTVSATYIGSTGNRLIQTSDVLSPNSSYAEAILVGNTATSNYNALQLQFNRRLVRGLQALVSYTWSHSIDDGSAGSFGNAANTLVPGIDPNQNRGPSDFDIRNACTAALTYDIPRPNLSGIARVAFGGWSMQNMFQAHSATPVNVFDSEFYTLLNGATAVRPDIVPGIPQYLYGNSYPGGKAFNPAAFTPPPSDPSTGLPLRQGTLGRNALRGFGVAQWDFAVHRDFPIGENLKLQFRTEMFNVLNHPNFAPPIGDIFNPQFGLSTQMLGQSLSDGNVAGGGGLSPLYQIGGPRSIQVALKLFF